MFLGTPAIAVPPLRALVGAGFDVAQVITRPDKRRGRGSTLSPSPVKTAATELGLAVSHNVEAALHVGAELGVVVAFGRLIKPHVLDQLSMVNLHLSLLPRWRGAAPVERAILAGDTLTGVCLMAVEETLDTGPVYRRAEVEIGPHQTADELRTELVKVGTGLLVEQLGEGLVAPEPQQGEPAYADKLSADDLRIDWSAPAVQVERVVRVGGAWTTWRGRRLKVWRAEAQTEGTATAGAGATTSAGAGIDATAVALAPGQLDGTTVGTGDGWVELLEVQGEGKARQPAKQWLLGARPAATDRLGP